MIIGGKIVNSMSCQKNVSKLEISYIKQSMVKTRPATDPDSS